MCLLQIQAANDIGFIIDFSWESFFFSQMLLILVSIQYSPYSNVLYDNF